MASRILVVDDDPALLDSVVEVLARDGYELEVARDGETALRSVLADPPDLIVLDVGIPQINGWEVCNIVRRQSHTRQVPVIFLTGRGQVLDQITSMQAGGSDHLTKPFTAADLRAKVRALVNRRDAEVARG